jgi:phage terminase large subunit-like protein
MQQSLLSRVKRKEELQRKLAYMKKYPWILNKDFTACNQHKLYPWQQEFLKTRERLAFVTAANQIGKSSAQILKVLNLSWRPELWPIYFGKKTPRLFIYLYPDKDTATDEFLTKWKPYMTTDPDDPQYGYKAEFDQKKIKRIVFTTGVTLTFKFYSQSASNLQANTADLVAMDEECPQAIWDELMVRTQSTRMAGSGLVSMVFTATLGQAYLFDTMERRGTPQEKFKNAFKNQISLYDCLTFADGSPNPNLTVKKIEEEIIPTYSSQNEIDKRVFGRFVKDSGLLFYFNEDLNTEPYDWEMVKDWMFFTGVDFGSGGQWGHSSAISLVAIDPSWSQVRLVKSYHSQKLRMTQGDLLETFKKRFRKYNATNYFDGAAVDFGQLADREAVPFLPAEKSHEIGVGLLNSLFKTGQLKIFTGHEAGDNQIIVQELMQVDSDTPKKNRVDDGADSLRYAIAAQAVRITPLKSISQVKKEKIKHPRMRFYMGLDKDDQEQTDLADSMEQLISEAVSMFEEYGL